MVVPRPSVLAAVSSPPRARARSAATVRPMPLPEVCTVPWPRQKRLKMHGSASCGDADARIGHLKTATAPED
jgi:hypothetical protein